MRNINNDDIVKCLVSEGVIELIEGKPYYCGLGTFCDDSQHKMYSATITIGDENKVFVNSEMSLHAWKEFFETNEEPKLLSKDEKKL